METPPLVHIPAGGTARFSEILFTSWIRPGLLQFHCFLVIPTGSPEAQQWGNVVRHLLYRLFKGLYDSLVFMMKLAVFLTNHAFVPC